MDKSTFSRLLYIHLFVIEKIGRINRSFQELIIPVNQRIFVF